MRLAISVGHRNVAGTNLYRARAQLGGALLPARGPLQPLAPGEHVLRVVGGAIGVGEYQLTLRLDDGMSSSTSS